MDDSMLISDEADCAGLSVVVMATPAATAATPAPTSVALDWVAFALVLRRRAPVLAAARTEERANMVAGFAAMV